MMCSSMNESMDVTFLLGNYSSMELLHSTTKHIVTKIINPLARHNYDLRLAMIKVTCGDNSQISTVHPFTRSIIDFENCLVDDNSLSNRNIKDGTVGICSGLEQALNLVWRRTDNNGYHENIVFLITDGIPCRHLVNCKIEENNYSSCACEKLYAISDQFAERDITLVIIGIGELVSICDNLYGDIAKNTRGEYIPLINANHIWILLIKLIKEGYSLTQSFSHIKQEEFEKNSSYHYINKKQINQFESKHCQIMAEKGEWILKNLRQDK